MHIDFQFSEEVPLGDALGLLLDVLKQPLAPGAPAVARALVTAAAQDDVHVSRVAKCEVRGPLRVPVKPCNDHRLYKLRSSF